MRGPDIRIGGFYNIRLSGQVQAVQVVAREGHGYACINPATNRSVAVKSARRFRSPARIPPGFERDIAPAPASVVEIADQRPGGMVEVKCPCGERFRGGTHLPKDAQAAITAYWSHHRRCPASQARERARRVR